MSSYNSDTNINIKNNYKNHDYPLTSTTNFVDAYIDAYASSIEFYF